MQLAIARAPFLRFPNYNNRFVIATDASWYGIGAVVYQPDDIQDTITPNNIVAIYSKKLTETQQRYPIYKKELWSLIYALRKAHTYIWGRDDTRVYTDHKPLIHILTQRQLSVALQQWLDTLLAYNLDIKYRPGLLHVLPDRLSRLYAQIYKDDPTWGLKHNIHINKIADEHLTASDILTLDSIQQELLNKQKKKIKTEIKQMKPKEQIMINHIIADMTVDYDDILITEEVHMLREEQTQVNAMTTRSQGHTTDTNNQLTTQQTQPNKNINITLPDRKCNTPDTQEERMKIIQAAHDEGHFGVLAVYRNIIAQGYWWPHLTDQIKQQIQACIPCQQYNVSKHGFHPMTFPHASLPWDHIVMDLVQFTATPTTCAHALVLIDVFTNFIIIRALPDATSESIAKELHSIFALLGPPKILQSDRGSTFLNSTLQAFTQLHHVRHKFAASYHPQTNGKVERVIGTIRIIMNKLVKGNFTEWPYYIEAVQYYYNNKINELTQSTPFSLLLGRQANKYDNYEIALEKPITKQQWYEHQQKIISLIYPTITSKYIKLKKEQVRKYNELRKNLLLESLPPGTHVSIKNINYAAKKDPKYLSGYVVVKRTIQGPYLLRGPDGELYDRLVSIDQIKALRRLPAKLKQDKEGTQYVVERIIDHSDENEDGTKERQYLVKWLGYQQPTWQPVDDLDHCTQLINEYWNEQQAKGSASKPRTKRQQ